MAREIQEQVAQLSQRGKVVKLSVVGYSLGGLISRYAIGILYHQGLFKDVEPVNFTTFCTPHVGVLTPGSNMAVRIFNWLVPNLTSLSGRQMFLKDSTETPILSLMANPNSVFYRALQGFKHRALYANAINDKRTSWWTAGISIVDPFIQIDERSSLDELEYKFVEGYAPIVLDSRQPFKISTKRVESIPLDQVSNFWGRKYRWIIVGLNLVFFMPLWATWFIISGIMETVKSHQRIQLILRDYNTYFSDLADLIELEAEPTEKPLEDQFEKDIEQTLQDRADTLMESVWDAISSKDAMENAKLSAIDISVQSELTPVESNLGAINVSIDVLSYFDNKSELSENKVVRLFTLDMYPMQLEIIRSLNELHWDKYPVLIRHTKATHSAAIVRGMGDPQFVEGKTVVRHWLDKVLRI